MSENIEKSQTSIPFFQIIYRKLVLIILVTVFCALAGLCYSLLFVKPTYTAQSSVILKMAVSDEGTSENANNATLAKRYLPTVAEVINSPKVISDTNEDLKASSLSISARNISVNYGDKSMVFSISYKDANAENAKLKLEQLIKNASDVLKNGDIIEAESVAIVPTQNKYNVIVDNGFTMPIILGFIIGLVISVGIAFLIYFLDNTVRNKDELEQLTGVSVIAYVENK